MAATIPFGTPRRYTISANDEIVYFYYEGYFTLFHRHSPQQSKVTSLDMQGHDIIDMNGYQQQYGSGIVQRNEENPREECPPVVPTVTLEHDKCRDELISESLVKYNSKLGSCIETIKDLQRTAINALLDGKDCICCLPTGYGKSFVYEFLPFLITQCLVIVIAPLNAIIEQQIRKLGSIASSLKSISVAQHMRDGNIKFLFAHPEEIIGNKEFNDYFSSNTFRQTETCVFLVVDEAHCILDWGVDFRPKFKQLSQLRSVLKCQVLALSATVTEAGRKLITQSLLMTHCVTVCSRPAKENISLIVCSRPSPNAKGNTASSPYDHIFLPILSALYREMETFPITIIYCKALQWIGYGYQLARQKLEDRFYCGEALPENARVVMFHSSMEKDSGKLKSMILNNLQMPDDDCHIRLILSTVALGMGADLRHVKRVIHAGPPTSLEAYVQETGRAGRAGNESQAILFVNNSDLGSANVRKDMKEYCKNSTKCRRELINKYFGFDTDKTSACCDICCPDIDLHQQFQQQCIL